MSESVLNRAKLAATGYGQGSAFPIGNGTGNRSVGNDVVQNRAKNSSSNGSAAPTVNATYAPVRTGDDGTTYDASLAQVQVDAETDTVHGQLKKYSDFSSPLMKRIAATAREKANSRGLGNSTIAQGAANGAVLDKAVQMATTDAQIYSNRRTENQRAGTQLETTAMSNRTSRANTESSNSARIKAAGIQASATLQAAQINADTQLKAVTLNNGFKADQAALDREHQAFQNERERTLRENISALDAGVKLQVAQMDVEAKKLLQQNDAVNSAWSSYTNGIATIDPNAKSTSQQAQADRLKAAFEARMEFLNGGLYGNLPTSGSSGVPSSGANTGMPWGAQRG